MSDTEVFIKEEVRVASCPIAIPPFLLFLVSAGLSSPLLHSLLAFLQLLTLCVTQGVPASFLPLCHCTMNSKSLTVLVLCAILVSGTFAQYGASMGGGLSNILPYLMLGQGGGDNMGLLWLLMSMGGQSGGGGMGNFLPLMLMGGMGSDRMMRLAPFMMSMGGGMGGGMGGSGGAGAGGMGGGIGPTGGGLTGPI
ncbi:hypothetical protein ACOMHN_021751 [Nucella lapillus]